MRPFLSCLAAGILLAYPPNAGAATLHVPAEYPTIQAGMDAAAPGDTVLVACGTYLAWNMVMKPGICLRSEGGDPECVTISGGGGASTILWCDHVDLETRIEGLTLSEGLAEVGGAIYMYGSHGLTLSRCVFRRNVAWYAAGAVLCQESSPLFQSCDFDENAIRYDLEINAGAGLYCLNSSPTFVDCAFRDNIVPTAASRGGAMSCENSSVTLTDCLVSGNRLGPGGVGAGIACSHSTLALGGCTFVDNAAPGGGGGVFCDFSPVSVTGCAFYGNSGNYGGAIYYWRYSPATITGCTFYGNSAWPGAATYAYYSPTILKNSIVAFNLRGEPVYCTGSGSAVTVGCCDVFGNEGGDWVGCISGQSGIHGNFSADPLFCDPEHGDLTLRGHSPCLPGEHPQGYDCDLIGALGWGCGDPTATWPSTWGLLKSRFREPGAR